MNFTQCVSTVFFICATQLIAQQPPVPEDIPRLLKQNSEGAIACICKQLSGLGGALSAVDTRIKNEYCRDSVDLQIRIGQFEDLRDNFEETIDDLDGGKMSEANWKELEDIFEATEKMEQRDESQAESNKIEDSVTDANVYRRIVELLALCHS